VSRRLLAVIVGVAVAAGLGVGLWLALTGGGGSGGGPTRPEYLARVSRVCSTYARRLGRIGAPPDVTAYGDMIATVGRVVPLLRRQGAAMQAVSAPPALQPRLDRLFALNDRSIAELEAVRASARGRDAGAVLRGLVRFSALRNESHTLAVAIGIRCQTN
jgi:hypothetical protein